MRLLLLPRPHLAGARLGPSGMRRAGRRALPHTLLGLSLRPLRRTMLGVVRSGLDGGHALGLHVAHLLPWLTSTRGAARCLAPCRRLVARGLRAGSLRRPLGGRGPLLDRSLLGRRARAMLRTRGLLWLACGTLPLLSLSRLALLAARRLLSRLRRPTLARMCLALADDPRTLLANAGPLPRVAILARIGNAACPGTIELCAR